MKGKVLPRSLFTDTAKAPEHFTELTFSAAKRCRAKGTGTVEESQSGEARAVGEETRTPAPNLSAV